jgi:hypothetical protein
MYPPGNKIGDLAFGIVRDIISAEEESRSWYRPRASSLQDAE